MSLGMSLPSHDVPPFSIVKGYHKEIKPDAGTLQLEVQHQYDAYSSCLNGKPPCPKNWSRKKCIEFLNDYPVTIPEEITFLQNQIANYNKIQESINNSRKEEDERVIQRNWTSDIPFLCLYHTLTDDSLQAEFAHSLCVKTREELDGSKSALFSNYCEMAEKNLMTRVGFHCFTGFTS